MLKSLFRALAAVTVVALVAPLVGCNGARDDAVNALNKNGKTGFLVKEHKRASGEVRRYGMFVPNSYAKSIKYPVIIFLHGVGEGGSDARSNLRVGLAPFVADRANSFPFIVIFPQSSGGGWSASGAEADDIIGILNTVSKEYNVDMDRVSLTGLSTGGYGTWAIGAKYANTFAALAPMGSSSAIGDTEAKMLADAKIPIRAYANPGDMFAGMGLNDPGMVERVKKYGGKAEFLDDVRGSGHNIWDPVYSDGRLFNWLLTQRLSARGVKPNTVTAAPARATSNATPAQPSVSTPAKTTSSSAIIPATPY